MLSCFQAVFLIMVSDSVVRFAGGETWDRYSSITQRLSIVFKAKLLVNMFVGLPDVSQDLDYGAMEIVVVGPGGRRELEIIVLIQGRRNTQLK